MNLNGKILRVALCSAVLSIGLASRVQAEHSPAPSDVMKSDSLTEGQKHDFQSDNDQQRNVNDGKGGTQGAKTLKGELFRIENANYFVKGQDGTEVRLHTDKTTKMVGTIKKGDRIEARVNDQNHALSIHAIK